MPSCSSPYAGKRVALATRHGKERVIARPLRHGLGAELLHLSGIDTDRLGSFCGTVERRGSARDACLAKAELALQQGGTGLAIASEGSFGPHPLVPLLAVGLECMVFVDQERGLTIEEQLIARRTNHSSHQLSQGAGLYPPERQAFERWLGSIGFPDHAVLIRTDRVIAKGIHSRDQLEQLLLQATSQGMVSVETDMRAHCNPTRMGSIRELAFRLIRRIGQSCPACGTPGWGQIERLPGLPCQDCGQPTPLLRTEVLGCSQCGHQQYRGRPDGRSSADPAHCPSCNP